MCRTKCAHASTLSLVELRHEYASVGMAVKIKQNAQKTDCKNRPKDMFALTCWLKLHVMPFRSETPSEPFILANWSLQRTADIQSPFSRLTRTSRRTSLLPAPLKSSSPRRPDHLLPRRPDPPGEDLAQLIPSLLPRRPTPGLSSSSTHHLVVLAQLLASPRSSPAQLLAVPLGSPRLAKILVTPLGPIATTT